MIKVDLTFPLKKTWYYKIRNGEKYIEYRLVKPYWTKRFAKVCQTNNFKVEARNIVKMALAVQENSGVSHTPFKPQRGERMNKNPMGATRVPKKEVNRDLPGRSKAVK